MAESNPLKWVVLALVAAGLFAFGLTALVQSKVDAAKAKAAAEARAMEARMQERDRQIGGRLQAAAAVAAPFVAHVGAGRFAEAHALLAAPFREAVTPEAFAKSCRASALLAGARSVTIRELRQQSAGGASTLEARGLLDSSAGAVPVSFVFLPEPPGPRILAVSLAGVPVLQGVSAAR